MKPPSVANVVMHKIKTDQKYSLDRHFKCSCVRIHMRATFIDINILL